jgi:superoxide dismutase, Cu-Zn family
MTRGGDAPSQGGTVVSQRFRFRFLPLLAAVALAWPAAGCNTSHLKAGIGPTQGNTAKGEVRFYKVDAGVRVVAKIDGLSPGKHGFHVHEKGDCSAPDASSAGGHFNPDGAPHGAPTAPRGARHVGDLGNLEAGPDGTARYDRVDALLDYAQLTGLSVLVHAGEDDYVSQPAGNSGARIGCGVVGMP